MWDLTLLDYGISYQKLEEREHIWTALSKIEYLYSI